MRQLLLDLIPTAPAQSLKNFLVGQNRAALAALQDLVDSRRDQERLHYIWGEAGCGKSHLLCALQVAANGLHLDPSSPTEAFTLSDAHDLYLVDDVDRLNLAQQTALFALYNQIQTNPRLALVISGPCAPLQLAQYALREDLRTRLGAMLIWHIQSLSDTEIAAALDQIANARGLRLHADVLPWLLAHWERSLPALLALLDALDRYSLQRQRAIITLPLLRDLLRDLLQSSHT